MKRMLKLVAALSLVLCLFAFFSPSVYAVTEGEVESVVSSKGREAVAGNIFIWFMCAIAFLKMSQKIDSFMSSLGINVGHTGGSMLAEAMIAMRTIGSAAGGKLGGLGGGKNGGAGGGGSSGGGSGDGAMGGFMAGGLAGAAGRSFSRNAANSVTGQNSGISGGLSKAMYNSSLANGGKFATNVTSSVARGRIGTAGSITGETASAAFQSYMQVPTNVGGVDDAGAGAGGIDGDGHAIPSYQDVEIGGGRISGLEQEYVDSTPVQFTYYSADQYSRPEGDFTVHTAADKSQWYKQYARDKVEKTPYMTEDGSVAYRSKIISAMPDPPRRKERL